jgi:hydrogenase/urease accessory protein HupE
MASFNMETAIGISFVLGLILPLVGLGGIISLVVMGFVATYLTRPEITSAKVGGIATVVFCVFFFFFGFLTPPTLPYILPNPLSLGVLVAFSGILNLIFSLIVSIVIYGAFGLLGGYIAIRFFMEKKEKKTEFKPTNTTKPRRTLKRA